MKNFKSFIKDYRGFSGITHWLFGICAFFGLWLLPIDFSKNYVIYITQSILFAFTTFLTVSGSVMFPDLDSNPIQEGGSFALYQLGLIGHAISIFMITVSGVVYTILHTSVDEKPQSQHRMLFHAPSVPISFFIIVYFSKFGNGSISSRGWNDTPVMIYIIVFLAAICVYLGAAMLFYKALSIFHQENKTQFLNIVCTAVSIYMMYNMDFDRIKMLGYAVSFGYLVHVISDLFSQGSIPLFFPLPMPVSFKNWKLQIWKKPRIPFAIETGGAINTILNFILTIIAGGLFYKIFIK